jgi:hypothetical protein
VWGENMDIEQPSSAEILIDGEKIAGRLVKPWTITKCAAVTPVFEKITAELKKRKLTFQDFFAKKDDGTVESINIEQLFFAIMPYVPELIKITLDIDDEEVDKIAQEDMMNYVAVIARQNIGYIKNLFALITTAMQMLRKMTV